MYSPSDMDIFLLQAELCKAFADPKRLFIIKELSDGERSVGELAEKMGVRPTNVSQHLTVLRDRSVVQARREATTVYYRLADPKIAEACRLVRQILIDQMEKNRTLAERLGA
jgi:ArsR family transcriptional regulator